jgi:hypothetical protein
MSGIRRTALALTLAALLPSCRGPWRERRPLTPHGCPCTAPAALLTLAVDHRAAPERPGEKCHG